MNLFKRDFIYIIKKYRLGLILLMMLYAYVFYICSVNDGSPMENFFYVAYTDNGPISNYKDFFLADKWLLLHLIPIIGTSFTIIKDHYDNGIYNIMKVRNKTDYFFSKLVSSILINIISILIFAIPFYIYSISNGPIDSELRILFIDVMICMIVENVVLSIIFILISLRFSTTIGILVILINLILAMATSIPFIIGQGSLAYKQKVLGGIFDFKYNIIFLIILTLIVLLYSYIFFVNYSYYGDER